jgi:hypothetical protein
MRWQLAQDREHAAEGRDAGTDVAFWTSPVGAAARARLRGDHFFQIELDGATLTAYAESAARSSADSAAGRRARRTCDLLGQIEELGWHLEHVSWWGVDTNDATPSPRRSPHDGDRVRGVYLFHTDPSADADLTSISGAARGVEHAPSHRREVG